MIALAAASAAAALPSGVATARTVTADRGPVAGLARPAADNPAVRGALAPVAGTVAGLTGAAAERAAGAQADHFRRFAARRAATLAAAAPSGGSTARRTSAQAAEPFADPEVHMAWGVFFNSTAGKGLQATHSVLGVAPRAGEWVYAPTALPPGGACSELTTAYSSSGAVLWAWDWCNGRDRIGKMVPMDSSFLSRYTTTVNGRPAYSMQEVQSSASDNTWTTYLYNFTSHAWDVFYSSSGTPSLGPDYTWDVFEIYSNRDPATGQGYYCRDMIGTAFEASDLQVNRNGTWTAAGSQNSRVYQSPSGGSFICPSLSLSLVTPNNHWLARIAG